jgi:hypothetical protein
VLFDWNRSSEQPIYRDRSTEFTRLALAKFCRANRNSEFYQFLLFYREVGIGASKFSA